MDQCSGFSMVERRAFWRMAVELQRQSGLSGTEFCRREQINAKTFLKWRQRLAACAAMESRGPMGPADGRPGDSGHRPNHHPPVSACGHGATVNPLFLPLRIESESMTYPTGHGSWADRAAGAADSDTAGRGCAVEIILRGQRRIMLRDDGRVPMCLAEVVRVLESVENAAVTSVAAGARVSTVPPAAAALAVGQGEVC